MGYTIKEVSKMTGIPSTTLRYYDKEGLLPYLERRESGYRVFNESDLTMLQIVDCLKSTGMPIKDIKQFSKWAQEGDSSLQERYDLFLKRKEVVEEQIADLQKTLDVINHKCAYYKSAVEAGTEKELMKHDKLPHADEFLCQNYESGQK
ncbi:MerR family transcriptional regulator [Lactobacillus sp.]|uniref:MerR family transcriptional regulator n=1 Tax=Lactobacillus sp. TaxID=1591 RepID=UPI003F0943A3